MVIPKNINDVLALSFAEGQFQLRQKLRENMILLLNEKFQLALINLHKNEKSTEQVIFDLLTSIIGKE